MIKIRYLAALIIIFCFAGCGDSQKQNKVSSITIQEKLDPNIPQYTIVNRDKYDARIKTQIVYHAVVSGKITEKGLKNLLQELYNQANSTRGFKNHGGKPTHVAIYLYMTKEHYKSGMGQWIAMLTKMGEDSKIESQIRTELISQSDAKPELKYGLPEDQRKAIFQASLIAERDAQIDAERMCPLLDPSEPGYSQVKAHEELTKQAQFMSTLREKNKSKVLELFNITQEQLDSVEIEGLTKNWPMIYDN